MAKVHMERTSWGPVANHMLAQFNFNKDVFSKRLAMAYISRGEFH